MDKADIDEFDRGYKLGQRDCNEYFNERLLSLKNDIEKLKEYSRNENWSMVEIQAERIGYYIEDIN